MKLHRVALVALFPVWACAGAAESPGTGVFSAATLERAFEDGCSLVVAEILSAREEDTTCYFKTRIVRTLVAGDLEKEDVQNPRELAVDVSRRGALRPGSSYALFIRRDCPYKLTWAFADDTLEVDPSDKDVVGRLTAVADRVYAKTAILRFRRGQVWPNNELPALPDEVASLCKEFRQRPRAEIGRRICASGLGSHVGASRPGSAAPVYLPPRIPCSRQQVVSLLGRYPTVKSGWTYSWCCDEPYGAMGTEPNVGVIRVTFDKDDRAIRIIYETHARSQWLRRMTPAERLAEMEGDPAGVAGAFQEAVKSSDWGRALSYCSPAVRAKAGEFDSLAAFFQRFVPVKEILSRPFHPNLFSSRNGRVVEMSALVGLYVEGEEDWFPEWLWSLVRADEGWLVDFELFSRDDFLQKARVKRELMKRGRGTNSGEFDKAIRYVLAPMSEEFAIGRPMRFRLEMRNIGDKPIGYYRTSVMLNDPMLVTDPNGQTLPYVDTSYQVMMGDGAILPGEAVVLADGYDVTTQYQILRPGRYKFQFKYYRHTSNTCEVDVKPGPWPDRERVVESLVPVLPAGWKWARSLTSRSGVVEDGPGQPLYITLIGKPGGLGNPYEMTLYILPGGDPADVDPWLKEEFDFWGLGRWGPVYARVNRTAELWPDQQAQITRALGVKTP